MRVCCAGRETKRRRRRRNPEKFAESAVLCCQSCARTFGLATGCVASRRAEREATSLAGDYITRSKPRESAAATLAAANESLLLSFVLSARIVVGYFYTRSLADVFLLLLLLLLFLSLLLLSLLLNVHPKWQTRAENGKWLISGRARLRSIREGRWPAVVGR